MKHAHFGHQDKILLLQHGCTDLLTLAQRRGAPLHKLLAGTGIFEQDLHKPHGRLHHADWLKLLHNSQQHLNSPELPFLLGSALLHNHYISLCQTVLHAENLSQALRQLYYFRHQLFPSIYVQLCRQPQHLVLEFHSGIALGPQNNSCISTVLSLLLNLIKQQLGNTEGVSVQLQHDTATAVQSQLHWGCEVVANQACNSLHIALPKLQLPFHTADKAKCTAALRTCRQLNRILPRQRGLLERIYRLQRRSLPQLLSLEQVAQQLDISVNTLKRQLKQQKTNFAQQLDAIRRDAARQLLQQGHYSNRQLAIRLGYSDEHNFRRAFKRWTGLLPSNFKSLLNSPSL